MEEEERAAKLTAFRVKEARRAGRRECVEMVYRYPGYTLEGAYELPLGDRRLLLTYARLYRSEELLELLNIATASQSKEGYQKLANDLKSAINELTNQL